MMHFTSEQGWQNAALLCGVICVARKTVKNAFWGVFAIGAIRKKKILFKPELKFNEDTFFSSGSNSLRIKYERN